MATKDLGTGNSRRTSSSTKNRNAYCSFCRKSHRDVGPLVEGPGEVYICGGCVELCQSIIDQEKKRRGSPKGKIADIPPPHQGKARPVRHRPEPRQARPLRRRAQPLQAAEPPRRRTERGRDRQEQ